jgi:eukaryotic-like serine/threonine-protein kinase
MSGNSLAMQAFGEGMGRLSRGDAAAAASAFEQAARRDPTFAVAWIRLAESQERLGQDEQALASAREAARLLVDRPGRLAIEASARVAALSGDLGHAERKLKTLVTRYRGDVEARLQLAEVYGKQGELESAQRELRAVTAASPGHPRGWYLLGKYAILAGEYRAAAEDYLVRALVIQDGLGNVAGSADAENALGIALAGLGNTEAARRRYESAIALRREIGDERGVAATTANLARMELDEGRIESARTGLQQALQIVERLGDRQTLANLHNELGALAEHEGRFGDALERYRRSLKLFRELGDQRAIAECSNSVAFMHYELGDFENAAVYAGQAMQLSDDTGNREGRMFTQQTVGQLALARGDWANAERAFLDMLQLSREFENRPAEAVANAQLARTAAYQGRFGAARKSVESGVGALAADADPRADVELALIEAEIALELGMPNEAGRSLARAEELLESSGSREHRAEWLRLSGMHRLREGDVRGARRFFDGAVRQATESGIVMTRMAAEIGIAEAMLAAGNAHGAAVALRRLGDEARAIGHVPLELESVELLANAESRAGRDMLARERLQAAVRKAARHEPWAGGYRLHWSLAESLRAAGYADEAERQGRRAREELARLRESLEGPMRESFDSLAVVMRIEGPEYPIRASLDGVGIVALSTEVAGAQ